MSAVVVDTHTIIWYLAGDPRLSRDATDILDEATVNGEPIHVPSICLVELTYLVEKGRIPAVARERLVAAIDDPGTPCMLASLDRRVVDAVAQVTGPKCRICPTALSPGRRRHFTCRSSAVMAGSAHPESRRSGDFLLHGRTCR